MSGLPGMMLADAAKLDPDGFDHDTCVCNLPIIRPKDHPDMGWYHATGERGCRAALFYVDKEAWSNSTTRANARPKKH
jgi:hypothetical protein